MRTRLLTGLAGLALTLGTSALAPKLAQAQAAERLDPAEVSKMLAQVATTLETRYIDPATGQRYAATVRANASRYATLATRRALAERITADLQAVHPDGHLRLEASDTRPAPETTATPAPTEPPAEIAPGIAEARWIDGAIAYIRFRGFSDDPAAAAALARFLADHAKARALIIDSRDNGGGSFPVLGILGDALYDREQPLVAMDMAAKVVERYGSPWQDCPELRVAPGPAGLVRKVHWAIPSRAAAALGKVPVYYLTSRRTFSAAEHMAFALKVTGRAMLIGETTGGGNHFGGMEPVGAGLEMFVPAGRTSDLATGADWEGVGVAPDVAVPADRALDEALERIGTPPSPRP
jgi:hypothetical protein